MKTFCCCCCEAPVAQASLRIGISLALLSVVAVIYTLYNIVRLDTLQDTVKGLNISSGDTSIEDVIDGAKTLLIAQLVGGLIMLLFSVILVIGAKKSNKNLVLAFLIFFGINLAFYLISIIAGFVNPEYVFGELVMQEIRAEHSEHTANFIVILSMFLLSLLFALYVYMFMAVQSYYKELVADTNHQNFRQIPMV